MTALELIAFSERPPTIDELARALDVHRSIAYRIVRTLEDHALARRDIDGRLEPGERLAALGRNVRTPLRSAAVPELTAMADALGMTAFLVVRIGDEAVTIESIEPRTSSVHVAYRPGSRHPVDRGAPGIALLAGAAPVRGERREVGVARDRGWATSSGEVTRGLVSVATWIAGPDGHPAASVACIYPAGADGDGDAAPSTDTIVARVRAAADAISHAIGGRP